MQRSLFVFCFLAGVASLLAAEAPEWACSPPNPKNPSCPAPYEGDDRCTDAFCPPYAGCAKPSCNPVQGNIKADRMVALDALVVMGDKCTRDSFSLSECCQLCKQTEGCNSWSYCNDPAGCGRGCDQSVYGAAPGVVLQGDLMPEGYAEKLNPAHKCKPNGAFPVGTCSLKYLRPASVIGGVPILAGNQHGWVSGVLKKAAAALAANATADTAPDARVLATDNTTAKASELQPAANATGSSSDAASNSSTPAPAAPSSGTKSSAASAGVMMTTTLLLAAATAAAVLL